MKKKGLIAIYSLMSMIIVGLVVTVVVLAASTQYVGSNVSILYVASEIGGSVTATYQIGSNDAKSMSDSEGNTSIKFGSDQPTSILLLSPNETLTLGTKEDVLLSYTFNNSGEKYYASVAYADTDSSSPSKNLAFAYKTSTASSYDNKSSVLEVPSYGSATYIVKISVDNIYSSASLNGRITWTLTKEKPKEQEKVTLSVSGNTGDNCAISTSSFSYVTNEDKTQFKIVGAVPAPTTSTASGYVNGTFDTRSSTADATDSAYMTVSQLTNSSGAQFYYFCTTNVTGNTDYGYMDPGTIYYTSTDGTALENWYDIPTDPITLYACFMVPNFDGTTFTGTTNMVISNSVTSVSGNEAEGENCLGIEPEYTDDDVVLNSVTNVVIPNSVVSIGEMAFFGFGIKNITIPNSVSDVGMGGFYFVGDLLDITIPGSVKSTGIYCFTGCKSLESVTFLEGVNSIGGSSFFMCNSLKYVNIPNSIVDLTCPGFNGCDNLIYNTYNGVNYLGNSTTPYLVAVKPTSTDITSCTFADTTRFICDSAFDGCTSLTEVTIPDSVTSIGECVFEGCSALTNITIPDRVKSIGRSAFEGCTGLASITIPDSVTSIGSSAFEGCTSLNYKTTDNVKYLGNSTNPYLVAVKATSTDITSCTLADTTKVIYYQAFYNCNSLTSISIPDSVKSIGNSAFRDSGLTSITIGDSVTSIETYAFGWCTSLTSVTIPGSVTSIDACAFEGCTGLTSITFADTSKTWTVNGTSVAVTDPSTNATNLVKTYKSYNWTRNS